MTRIDHITIELTPNDLLAIAIRGVASLGGKETSACQSLGSTRDFTAGYSQEFTMLSIVLGLALATGAEPADQHPDIVAAKSWVQLVDNNQWDDSWAAAGTLFKSLMPQPRWASTIAPVRAPLGAVSSRVVKAVTHARSVPGAPDGDYEFVQFQTTFRNKAAATETVVLSREATGWKVDGYFIR